MAIGPWSYPAIVLPVPESYVAGGAWSPPGRGAAGGSPGRLVAAGGEAGEYRGGTAAPHLATAYTEGEHRPSLAAERGAVSRPHGWWFWRPRRQNHSNNPGLGLAP